MTGLTDPDGFWQAFKEVCDAGIFAADAPGVVEKGAGGAQNMDADVDWLLT